MPHPLFRNAATVPPGTRWVTLSALDHRPVTVAVVHPDGTRAELPGVCTAWTADRVLALVDVYVGTERYPTVLRVGDVRERRAAQDGQGGTQGHGEHTG